MCLCIWVYKVSLSVALLATLRFRKHKRCCPNHSTLGFKTGFTSRWCHNGYVHLLYSLVIIIAKHLIRIYFSGSIIVLQSVKITFIVKYNNSAKTQIARLTLLFAHTQTDRWLCWCHFLSLCIFPLIPQSQFPLQSLQTPLLPFESCWKKMTPGPSQIALKYHKCVCFHNG